MAQLSAAFAVVATALLVVGLFTDDGLILVWLSIGCSLVAGGLLLLVSVRNRRPAQEGAVTG